MSKKKHPQTLLAKDSLFRELKKLIEISRHELAVTVNASLSILYWQVGKRINDDILHNQRAEYGKEVMVTLAKQLSVEFGRGWSKRQLHHCRRFAEIFPDDNIVHTLCTQLSWSHIRLIIPEENEAKREFYIEMAKLERWSVRTFQERIDSMLFERTAISKRPELTIKNELIKLKENSLISPDLVFKDPYFLDFLGLKDYYTEGDLEHAILAELQRFLIEMGSDFAFLARQKRITIDYEDYYLDLLFFHRRLQCLVAIELKLGKFQAAYKGQMELYLRWLEKHETIKGENPPIGLILCASKNDEHIELLQLHTSNIKVAEYLTNLPDMKILEEKLVKAIEIARNRLSAQSS
jgi:predicted nuclease of restriction endonuclease-like (RecB) superfamily